MKRVVSVCLLLLMAACNRQTPQQQPAPAAPATEQSGGMGGVFGFLKDLVTSEPTEVPAPVRVTDPVPIPETLSNVAVPITVPLADLQRVIENAIPQTLWQIDQREDRCIAPARVAGVAVTPRLSCRIVGEVTRGRVRLSGRGQNIILRMPVSARITARDVAVVLRETATAEAEVQAVVRLTMGNDWNPRGTVRIDVDWREPPGITFLGIRINIASRTDPKLQQVIADLERKLPAELAKLGVRQQVEGVWRDLFTTEVLNRENPAVWMRITPQQMSFAGYTVGPRNVVFNAGMRARTETFIMEEKPQPRAATRLPPPGTPQRGTGFHFRIPVIAEYDQLVPVLEKALNKLAKKGIDAPVVGRVNVIFGTPIMYTTEGDRIAIGLPMRASHAESETTTGGLVWLTGKAVNEPGSQKIEVRDLKVVGEGEDATGELFIRIAQAPAVTELLSEELTQNFTNDFDKLMVKVDRALTDKRIGDFLLNVRINEVRHGVVLAVGQGLFLPVEALGNARMQYSPRRR